MNAVGFGALALASVVAGQSTGAVQIRDVAAELYPQLGAVIRVVDAAGRDVPGLGKGDFAVLEDGQRVPDFEVRPSFREGGTLAVELLVDTSGSMRNGPLEAAKAGAQAFLDRLGPDDRVGLISFGDPEVERAPIGPPAAITNLDSLTADGNTALYGAITLAMARLASQTAKARAIVVLTDGRDDEGDNRSGERFDRLRLALTGSTIPIHAVGFRSREYNPDPLRELAALTGGTYRDTDATSEFAALYRQIADVLLPEYRMSYKSAAGPGPHRLRIEAQTPGGKVAGEQTFNVVAPGSPPITTAPVKTSSGGAPVLALVLMAIAVLGVAGVVAYLGTRRARPLEPAGPAPPAERAHNGMVLEGPGVAIPLREGPILVGRDPSAQVIIDDSLVSRQHARLQVTADGVWVEDLGSANGTLLNGVVIQTAMLRPGDVLEIGELRLRLRAGNGQ